jgi:hypothetical protein
MPDDNALTVRLTGDARKFVEFCVENGLAPTPEAYLEGLLRAEYLRRKEQLRAELAEAAAELDRGEGVELDMEEIKATARRRWEAEQRKKGKASA